MFNADADADALDAAFFMDADADADAIESNCIRIRIY